MRNLIEFESIFEYNKKLNIILKMSFFYKKYRL